MQGLKEPRPTPLTQHHQPQQEANQTELPRPQSLLRSQILHLQLQASLQAATLQPRPQVDAGLQALELVLVMLHRLKAVPEGLRGSGGPQHPHREQALLSSSLQIMSDFSLLKDTEEDLMVHDPGQEEQPRGEEHTTPLVTGHTPSN